MFVCLHTVDAGWFFRYNINDDRMTWGLLVCFVLFVYILLMQVGFSGIILMTTEWHGACLFVLFVCLHTVDAGWVFFFEVCFYVNK